MEVDSIAAARRPPLQSLALAGVGVLIAIGLVAYSQTHAFAWDEGFHLLAAQLIFSGKRPYLDFIFPQTPLNAYWNAGWMGLFGEGWRPPHAVAALLATGAALLTADFVFVRFPFAHWRFAAAITAALLVGFNVLVVEFATLGQPYALCLLLIVVAFRLAIVAVERSNLLLMTAAGFSASAAAASSLLTAPVAPVLLAWLVVYSRPGTRVSAAGAFLAGAVLPFIAVFWLLLQGPRQVIFGIIEYHLLHRREAWLHALHNDLGVLLSWIDSGQALLLGLLSIAALIFVSSRTDWPKLRRAQFNLCGWLAVALGAHLSSAHPTFPRYYVFLVPFLAILAPLGLYALGLRLGFADRPLWPTLIVIALAATGLGKTLYDDWDDFSWQDMEQVASKVDEVTPAGGSLFADEHIYFLTRRPPPEGQEHRDSHKLKLPSNLLSLLHVVPQAEVDRRITNGMFDTVVLCERDKINTLAAANVYARKHEFPTMDCEVFWEPHVRRQNDDKEDHRW